MSMDAMRREYGGAPLNEDTAGADPDMLFQQWFGDAEAADPATANVMTLATADAEGLPDARIVLLKGHDDQGLCFFTQTVSVKGRQLAANDAVALVFHWRELDRQVRVRGRVTLLDRSAVAAYFASRPRASQIAAACADQSSVLGDRAELDQRYANLAADLGDGAVDLPSGWGGYLVRPWHWEFWQGQPSRLHDRLVYTQDAAGWCRQRLAP